MNVGRGMRDFGMRCSCQSSCLSAIRRSMEYLPGPLMKSKTNTERYSTASSFSAKGCPAWMLKMATHMVNIMGSSASLWRNPNMMANEPYTSAEMASSNEKVVPTPSGSGNCCCRMSKAAHFCRPCHRKNEPNTQRSANSRKDIGRACCRTGNRK